MELTNDPKQINTFVNRLYKDGSISLQFPPSIQECIRQVAGESWEYSHKNILDCFVFKHKESGQEVDFTLKELRFAAKYGW